MKVLIFELILIVLLIPINIMVKKHASRWRGKVGKKMVKRILSKLDHERYWVLHDVPVYTEYGYTTQIDHIVIAKTGIFFIETKNYEGWIYGSEKAARWTQGIFRKKHSFQNPFRQNYKHMKAIEWVMEQQLPCISIVTFHPKCSLKKVSVNSKGKHILYYGDLKKCIESYTHNQLTIDEVQHIYQSLVREKIKDKGMDNKYVEYLHNKFVKQ
ncbi:MULTISPECIES: nuclease-related domain-containing protein [Bacillus cereus group]|uniref:NERD domain-containing protein n=1 Tax=Bacillus cereus TaxID=1396 RepID=A0A9W7QF97_BACCE|nr:nuclease-related domain-containing protein [Bacillus cereus]KAB2393407.1 NERD domain-containing protein [Bacillus cereus]KAB2408135.1 NERD domain-containing protein [Bacillus cereus]KAB2428840.1 NERD domain-containing protein [Bacillus cereus]